ncbi:2-amino-3,7-dideoxy-D-threo-hept-6-ulosonate synthase [Patescibacteria group bacterium]|nr:fructose-bisphosphate aldolase [Candidatus Falkowbacteria bacterium]MBU3906245.1 2-amino-3,7-dideoxy-D-threo-hept-6-ulosonate synthase [Patescibacteria group bacterium]MCG2697877.1 2-amino-3,7-dideoxy-D-threo-hept-6-ulosonate synthase [Candidatus Parcubacteria bacterium]MBU4015697.1 2-amino-3,7-dideoxy-D-threo-hept-6-ulosonate synthase [Patescibacteria group bacterium]MBU4026874.1 2-amino-3,7-dideoxy-D-threo-hept-6-ulosonate synthase [Patescibacteria group bacterium]
MTILGKNIRMERIMNRETGKIIIVPMDHGISVGPIDGLRDMKSIIHKVADGGANAIVEHKGLIEASHRRHGKDIGLIIHLSGSTALSPYPNAKTLVCSVEEAIKLGADAVSIHVNLGNGGEKEMLHDFGKVAYEARTWGMPLLAMIYPRGEKIKDEYDVKVIKHAARVGNEMGADIVKVSYTGSTDTFREVVEGCSVPVVIAGGAKMDSDREILEMVKGAIDAGGAGVSIGRNVFQHRDPERMVRAISAIVNDNNSVENALKILNQQNFRSIAA